MAVLLNIINPIVIINIKESSKVSANDNSLCSNNGLTSLTWYEELNASINELTPLVEKYNARMNPIESNPPLGLLIMSSNVVNVISLVVSGRIIARISIKVSWKPSIGMYGMRVKNTITEGKNAKKKLNANEDALVVIEPSAIPSISSKTLGQETDNGLIYLSALCLIFLIPIFKCCWNICW